MAKGSRFPLCKDDGGTRDAESRNVPTHYLTKARGQTSRRKGNWRAVSSDKLHARFGGGCDPFSRNLERSKGVGAKGSVRTFENSMGVWVRTSVQLPPSGRLRARSRLMQ